ncbi:hypothetical protein HPB50_027405 [Hyalomma asiaticum]|uniref:Uncharacterized protein n=1 Tax=Hyalomma asiaticum TaxID=266040 RepID=A0ACB7RTA9_HYAAI|nr:hypothetical protein HPB50_027405 [Hyalomma asiaticum]
MFTHARCPHGQDTPPSTQFVPAKSYAFAKGKCNGSCQHVWFERSSWLHYVVDRDVVLCQECRVAFKERRVTGPRLSFLQIVFPNWNNAIDKFRRHGKSTYHVDAVQHQLSKAKVARVVELLTSNCTKQQHEPMEALRVIGHDVMHTRAREEMKRRLIKK